MQELTGIHGILRIYERHWGAWVLQAEAENLVLDAWYNNVFTYMSGVSQPDLTIRQLALGFSSLTPTPSDISLGQPWLDNRAQPIRYSLALSSTPAGGVCTYSFFSPATDTPPTTSPTFYEAGLYCGSADGSVRFLATRTSTLAYTKSPSTDVRIDYSLSKS